MAASIAEARQTRFSDSSFSQKSRSHCAAHGKRAGLKSGEKKRHTVEEGNKLHSERSCLVLLSAPLRRTQLLPGRHTVQYRKGQIFILITAVCSCALLLLPAGSTPPVAVRVVEALTEGQSVSDELLRLGLVCHLLLFGLALQL